jgi:aryl-alcohol dehydrogenase-like predicted oxidoreductase
MNNNSRRRFLKNATGLLATGLVSGTSLGNTLTDVRTPEKKKEIIYRTLGRTGIKVPIVSMGVMNSSNPNLVKMAWQSGIRHFDTAWGYQGGNNERMIGKVIKELKIDRQDVIITTKISLDSHLEKPGQGEARKKQFFSRFNQSLERLQTDYVDILMYHSVNNITEAGIERSRQNPVQSIFYTYTLA